MAARQRGRIARRQLLGAGLTSDQVKGWLATGRLHREHPGVYALGHAAPTPFGREQAAVLACGEGAVLSHASAAFVWGMAREPTGSVQLTRCGPHRRGPKGIHIHHSKSFEVRRREGLPITSPARTLIDLASTEPKALERALNEARIRRLVTHAELQAEIKTRRRGSATLRALLATGPTLTRSEAERRLVSLILKAQLPAPRTNTRVGGHEVDAYWPEQRLVVEVDGFAFHSSPAAFERDRLRDADLQELGLRVRRVTWKQLAETPERVVARLAVALAVAPAAG